jgi:hypothetical protein
MPKAVGIQGRLPLGPSAGQLSGDTDYIRKWLEQTDDGANQKRSDSRAAQQKTPSELLTPLIGAGAANTQFCSCIRPYRAQDARRGWLPLPDPRRRPGERIVSEEAKAPYVFRQLPARGTR